ncbi:serine aminopeptidase domain-containing protein [Streptomyces himalayensis]|uniref:Alpha/beta hydrolase n=1 Tax=Streptomyces himalayensis subsp. himalayensis TaxID=2756131 RepID=A0A7W0DIU3_9ACTN|nr:alpha/beta hydrolase [Streptomyces himalayensis]MBA2945760.1 alpha/beta hydrolase [Streptomyces himalayensis subsp. himalayensis]
MTDLATTPTARTATAHSWQPPAGIAPRGTLVVLPGRGEHGLVYERFGRRLSFDGYVVHALDTTPEHHSDDVLTATTQAVGPDPVAPVVLIGSDTGALQALHAATAAEPTRPTLHGLVLAGTAPTTGTGSAHADTDTASDWDAELNARTACPTHRQKLTADPDFARGRLTGPVPHHLLTDALPDVPTLVLHGAADPLTPLEQARTLAHRLPSATFGVLHEGLHDVLNDASHRTTAATLVQWLERLRADAELRPILTIEPLNKR